MFDSIRDFFTYTIDKESVKSVFTYYGHSDCDVERSIEKLYRHGYIDIDGVSVAFDEKCELNDLDYAVLRYMENETSEAKFDTGGLVFISLVLAIAGAAGIYAWLMT